MQTRVLAPFTMFPRVAENLHDSAWNAKITLQLRRMGFAPSNSDSSLFIWPSQTRPISILLYVDDLVIAGADLGEIRRVKSQLAASFDMKDLEILHYFPGIEVTITRLDLGYPLGLISQYMLQPKAEHLQCVQRILRYVNSTKDRVLLYQTGIAEQLVGYTDANWSGNARYRRSTTWFAFSLGSVAITWSNKK